VRIQPFGHVKPCFVLRMEQCDTPSVHGPSASKVFHIVPSLDSVGCSDRVPHPRDRPIKSVLMSSSVSKRKHHLHLHTMAVCARGGALGGSAQAQQQSTSFQQASTLCHVDVGSRIGLHVMQVQRAYPELTQVMCLARRETGSGQRELRTLPPFTRPGVCVRYCRYKHMRSYAQQVEEARGP